MVAIDMSLIPLKVIKINICLWAKGPYGLSKDLGPKRCLNIWKKEKSKKMRGFMKVEKKGVHCKKYDGHYMKQWIRIPKVT
jgi:hypothetical protein